MDLDTRDFEKLEPFEEVNQNDEYTELHKMGEEGWELINVVPVKIKFYSTGDRNYIERTDIRYFWKKPLEIERHDNAL